MTSALSKRHQARNERALQDLIKTVPGNDRCADCGARNPGWASWSLGIFLCMRCASLHRKLGTHISKVKSLSMDSWSNDQVDRMKLNGNLKTNRTFNPQNTKPPIPLDVDEVDAVLERFIRQKYDQQLFSGGQARPTARNDTGSSRSSEGEPPPLPPKPGKRFGFGFRSASSALPLQRSLPNSPPLSATDNVNGFGRPPSPIRVNKQSRVFGAFVGGGGGETEAKLTQLKDMGFMDESRNLQVLKKLNGNLEKTIESLVRLGEGSGPASRSRSPNAPINTAASRSIPSRTQSPGVTNGISFTTNGLLSPATTGSQGQQGHQSTEPPNPQPASNSNPPNYHYPQPQSHNPFELSSQQNSDVPLENTFQGMHISQPQQQPLFPNNTGGYPSHTPLPQEARYQTMTPPVPQVPQQYAQLNPYTQQGNPYRDSPGLNYNPFFPSTQPTQDSVTAISNPYISNTQPQSISPSFNSFPFQESFIQQPLGNGYPTESPQTYAPHVQQVGLQQQHLQQPQQQTQSFQQQASNMNAQYQQQHQSVPNLYSPQHSLMDPMQWAMPGQAQPPHQSTQFQPQPLQVQPTGRVDKSSILALYNYPQLAPPPLPTDSNPTSPTEPTLPKPGLKPGQRSATMPLQLSSGSRNPFHPVSGQNQSGTNGHISQESVDFGGYQNGRHSPDAFASLSARFVR